MPLTSGTRLGTYEIIAPIGAGGMGEVYRARDTRLGREVAVKVLPANVATQPDRLSRFEREARTVAGLNHPNIVVLHSVEDEDGIRFLTMELIEGQSLDRLVSPGGLPLARVLDLAVPLADALSAAHERSVVHRDLKPGNVMGTREGRVKVLDFGLAKLTTDDIMLEATQAATMAAPISTAGQVVGTVPYMAPEQLRGEPVDARTDLFSLGVLLYELVTGRRPFAGATSAEVSSSILRDIPTPVESVRAELPRDLGRIISRCLEKDPERRFQTAKDVRNELELVRRALEPGTSALSSAPRKAEPAAQDVPSIAVLPFANRSRDEADEYFAEGLADELLNVLAKIRGLRVAARTSSSQFKATTDDLATIGRKLNVATLLEGSVRKAGDRVRISVQLVKVADGYHLWSETFDRTLDDIFAVQDDIAQAVVKQLRTTLLGEEPDSKASGEVKAEVAAAALGRGADPQAHQLYVQGRYLVNRWAGHDVKRGIELLRQALAIEPDNALAWASLSVAETFVAITDTGLKEGIERAREAATRALALHADLPEALLAMGWIELWHDFDFKRADATFRRALELAPGHAQALHSTAMMALIVCRFDEALLYAHKSLEQDPLSIGNFGLLGRIYAAMDRPLEAQAAFRKGLAIAPDATSLRGLLALSLTFQGRHDEAMAEAMREHASWARLWILAVVHHRIGHAEESQRALDDLIAAHSAEAAYQVALVYVVRGERDQAFEWLERALEQRDSGLCFSKVHWILRPLHSDPRWKPLLARIGFTD